ncbi:MAG: DNA polymerase III subunit gamma/tau [Lachnospiraceae bacterium]|nr:DNA polymerase III subunit gamma/tau [Lachnospiraceae bacterium]
MSYTALYRKFRPADFGDVKGQDHIVKTLKNQLALGRIGHAYLFTGTRGTGKTSVAKILAKAVNCEHPTENGPCNECAMCKAISSQSAVNVVELDAASNNGVDNIREIVEAVQYSPAEGKYRVYIIDEVHMLSTGAFNALLKTLEEPPSYVIFILATTEVQKIPITILSRCQRYDFHRISNDTIFNRLNELMTAEGIESEEKALRYIAKAADGSMRDGLSILDQCIAFYLGEKLTYDRVLNVIGAADTEVFYRILTCINLGDVRGAIKIIEEIVMSGRELTWFVGEFIWYLRNMLIVSSTDDNCEDMIDMSGDNLKILKEQAGNLSTEVIIRYMRILSELSQSIRYSTQKRILVEIAIIKLCRPQMEDDITSLKERIRLLEIGMREGRHTVRVVEEAPQQATVEEPVVKLPLALPDDIKKVVDGWADIIGSLDPATQNTLRKMTLSIGDGANPSLLIVGTNKALTMILEEETNYRAISEAVNNHVGKEVNVLIKYITEDEESRGIYPDIERLSKQGIEISYE